MAGRFLYLPPLGSSGAPPKRAVCGTSRARQRQYSAHMCALLPQVGGRGATHSRELAAISRHRVLLVAHVDKPLRRNLSALLADRFESLREVGEEVGRRHMASLDGFLATLLLFYASDESSPPAGGMIGLHWLRATSTSCLRPATGRPPAGADDSPVRNDVTRSAWCNEFLWHTEQSRLWSPDFFPLLVRQG